MIANSKVTRVLLSTIVVCILHSVAVTSAPSDLQKKIDSLFVIASSGEVKFQTMVQPAIDSLAAIGVNTVPILIDKFTTKSARERLTIMNILKKIGTPAVPDLLIALRRTEGLVVERAAWTLGEIGDSAATEPLMKSVSHERWQVRDESLGALGKIKSHRAEPSILTGLLDSIGQVRKSAAVAAGRLGLNSAISGLTYMLGDDFYGARMAAGSSMLMLDTFQVIAVLADSLSKTKDTLTGNHICLVLGKLASDSSISALNRALASSDPHRRAHAAVGLALADPKDTSGYLKTYLARETDRLALLKVRSALQTDSFYNDR